MLESSCAWSSKAATVLKQRPLSGGEVGRASLTCFQSALLYSSVSIVFPGRTSLAAPDFAQKWLQKYSGSLNKFKKWNWLPSWNEFHNKTQRVPRSSNKSQRVPPKSLESLQWNSFDLPLQRTLCGTFITVITFKWCLFKVIKWPVIRRFAANWHSLGAHPLGVLSYWVSY